MDADGSRDDQAETAEGRASDDVGHEVVGKPEVFERHPEHQLMR